MGWFRTKSWSSLLCISAHDAEQFLLQYEFPFLVFLAGLVCFVVLPSYGFVALAAGDVAYDMAAGSHATLHSVRLVDIDDHVE